MDTNNLLELFASGSEERGEVMGEVPIEHLDFDYIAKCGDLKELRAILALLKSGREGKYPDLERAVEGRILECVPAETRSKMLSFGKEPSGEERREATESIATWLKNMTSSVDNAHNTKPAGLQQLPPARNIGAAVPKLVSTTSDPSRAVKDPKAEPFNSYYKRWDSFDVDAALTEMEREGGAGSGSRGVDGGADGKAAETVARSGTAAASSEERRGGERADGSKTNANNNTDDAAQHSMATKDSVKSAALREKLKGNEAMKERDYATAVRCYSASLSHDNSSKEAAIVFANRAQAHLSMANYALAEEDCDKAINCDAAYAKAWMRRGNVRSKRGKYAAAADDFDAAIRRDPTGDMVSTCATLAAEARKKSLEVGETIQGVSGTNAAMTGLKASGMEKSASSTYKTSSGRKVIIEEVEDEDELPAHQLKSTPTALTGKVAEPSKAASNAPVPGPPIISSSSAPAPSGTGKKIMIVEEEDSEVAGAVRPQSQLDHTQEVSKISHNSNIAEEPAADQRQAEASRYKADGNAAFSTGLYPEAVEKYSRALATLVSLGKPGVGGAAVILANRALAYVKFAANANDADRLAYLDHAVQDAGSCLSILGLRIPGELTVLVAAGDPELPTSTLLGMQAAHDASFEKLQLTTSADKLSGPALSRLLHNRAQVDELALGIQDQLSALSIELGDSTSSSALSLAVKALHRRASAFELKGDYLEALMNFAAAAALEPANEKVKGDLRRTRSLYKATAQPHAPAADKSLIEGQQRTQEVGLRTPEPAIKGTVVVQASSSSATKARLPADRPAAMDVVPITASVPRSAPMSPPLHKVVSHMSAVPTPPKTGFEFEQQINRRKADAAGLDAYIRSCFKVVFVQDSPLASDLQPSFRALYKRTLEPDLLMLLVNAVRSRRTTITVEDAQFNLSILLSLSKTPSWGALYRMLASDEKAALEEVFASAVSTLGETLGPADQMSTRSAIFG